MGSPSSLSPSLSPSRLSGTSLSLLPKYPQFHPPTTTLSFSLHIFSPSSPFNLPSILPSHPQYPPFSHFSTTNLTPPPLPIPLPSPYPASYPSTGVLILEITSRLSIASLHPLSSLGDLTRITALPTAVF